MIAYHPEEWRDLYVAMAGAVGLVFGFAGLIPRLPSLRSHEGRLV